MPEPILKTAAEIDCMACAGRLLWSILEEAKYMTRPGIRTAAIGSLIEASFRHAGADPVMMEAGFPSVAAICLNDEVVHSPPGSQLVRQGDLVTIDAALRLNGWCADAAISFVAGERHGAAADLARIAAEVLNASLEEIRPGVRWSVVSAAAEATASRLGCRLVREYASHGIGRSLHEAPALPFLPATKLTAEGKPDDPILIVGTVFSLEPIVTIGSGEIYGSPKGWAVRTVDRSLACYEERTLAVIDGGYRVLTCP